MSNTITHETHANTTVQELTAAIDTAPTPSIASSAVLVEQNISVWTARKMDKRRTRKVLDEAHASADAGRWSKNLMAGTSMRKAIFDFAQHCRNFHMDMTMPWSDKGVRLLPTSWLLEYKERHNSYEAQFNEMVENFLNEYDTLVADAANYLGDDYDPDDYPPVEVVARKFGYRVAFSPVPEAGDFRLDVGNEAVQELKSQYDSVYTTRIETAMTSAWDRLHEAVSHMVDEKLVDPEEGKKRVFHSNAVTKLEDLADALHHLNVTNDPKLEKARLDLLRSVEGVRVDDLKEDQYVREELRTNLESIRKTYW